MKIDGGLVRTDTNHTTLVFPVALALEVAS